VIVVLRKTARIQDPEVRADARPSVRGRFAAVVEPGPGEASGQIRLVGVELPPSFSSRCPWRPFQIVRLDISLFFVVGVDAARGDGAGSLGPEKRKMWKVLVELDDSLFVEIETLNIDDVGHALAAITSIHRHRERTGVVQSRGHLLHRAYDPCS